MAKFTKVQPACKSVYVMPLMTELSLKQWSSQIRTIEYDREKPQSQMDLDARKPVCGGLRTPKAQTNLCIRADCSAHFLFAFSVKIQFSSFVENPEDYS